MWLTNKSEDRKLFVVNQLLRDVVMLRGDNSILRSKLRAMRDNFEALAGPLCERCGTRQRLQGDELCSECSEWKAYEESNGWVPQ
jgi:hypothetical protein